MLRFRWRGRRLAKRLERRFERSDRLLLGFDGIVDAQNGFGRRR